LTDLLKVALAAILVLSQTIQTTVQIRKNGKGNLTEQQNHMLKSIYEYICLRSKKRDD